jgi:hypothetical protein
LAAYGTSGTVATPITYVLWARQDQVLTLHTSEGTAVRLTAPDGADVPFVNGGATLPATGDFLLTLHSVEQTTYNIDIR